MPGGKSVGDVGVLAWALPAPAVPFSASPRRAAFCRCQITLVLYFIVAEICAEAWGLKISLPMQDEAGMGAGWRKGNLLHLPTIVFLFAYINNLLFISYK